MPTVVFRELVVAIASYVLCSSNFRKLTMCIVPTMLLTVGHLISISISYVAS